MSSSWIWTTVAALAIFILFNTLVGKNKRKKSPPGPRGLPIIGHLHLLGKNLHQDLHKLAKVHGPIMRLQLGFVTNIIVSSPHAAEQFLKKYDLVFASRPPHETGKHISYEQRNLSFCQYGPYWRNMRKFCTVELLSTLKINSFQSMRREELKLLVNSLKQAAISGVPVDVTAEVSTLVANMSCLMIFGKKYADEPINQKGFKAVVQETMKLLAIPNLSDYFPHLGKLDLQGLTKRVKAVSTVFDEFLEKILNEHEQTPSEDQTNDFTHTLLALMKSAEIKFQIDRRNVKAIMLDLFAASMDTSATVVDWIICELLRHPRVMKKVQQELLEVVGMDKMVEELDMDGLKYLEMVIKESMRLHPAAPLLVPHEAVEDSIVEGLHIAKKSRIIINTWAIGRDPNTWSDPEKFIPERFDGSKIDVRGHNFQLIPFGSGRRVCPGMQLGLTMVKLVVAQLVHCFDWELPNKMLPEELDMTEEFALVMSRSKHLMAIPSYRLME